MEKIADILKPDMEERMNIQVTPWIEADVVEMEDLYTRLTIEKHKRKPHGVEKENITDENETNMEYKRLFTDETQHSKKTQQSKKILVKGDPGIGKSTLVRKIAWDWAKGLFESFVMLFVIVLKFVSPTDTIEEMIMEQNPILEGEDVKNETIKEILKLHGDKCLILLDGYDEMPINIVAIRKLIEKRLYPKCNIVLTSRPNSATSIEKYFSTIASVEGFSREKAKEYIGKILEDKSKKDVVMEYSETNEIEEMWRYPVLIMFLCLLVNKGEIDIDHEKLSLNDLYIRLHNFLYDRYIEKAGVPFNEEERENIFLKLGEIALEGLINQKHGFQKSFISKEVGKEIFEYGILIEDTDTRKLARGDVCVFFPHKTLQEFLAAKYLVAKAHEGRLSVEKLLGKQTSDFVQDNLMFFLIALENCLFLPRKETWRASVEDQIKGYIYNILKDCPTINIKSIALSGQTAGTMFGLISKCQRVVDLKMEGIRFDNSLALFLAQMTKLTIFRLTDCSYLNELSLDNAVVKSIKNMIITTKYKRDKITGLLEALLSFQYESLSTLEISSANLTGHDLQCLCKAYENNNFPLLTSLHINNNQGISGSLHLLFQTVWPQLEILNVLNCNLTNGDVNALLMQARTCIPKCQDIKVFSNSFTQEWFQKIRKILESASREIVLQHFPHEGTREFFQLFGKADQYVATNILLDGQNIDLDFIRPHLSELFVNLTACKLEKEDVRLLSDGNASGNLCMAQLVMSGNTSISGNLNELFHGQTAWKFNDILDCSNCNLQASDLISLSEANAAGYLPSLKQLYLASNKLLGGQLKGLMHNEPWKCLEELDCSYCDLKDSDLISLSEANVAGYLPVLKCLRLTWLIFENRGWLEGHLDELLHMTQSTWAYLEILEWGYFSDIKDVEFLLHALQEGRFPKLHTVGYRDDIYPHVPEELKRKIQKHVQLVPYK